MIDVAIGAARAAGDLAYSYFIKNLKVRYKTDNSPVTIRKSQNYHKIPFDTSTGTTASMIEVVKGPNF